MLYFIAFLFFTVAIVLKEAQPESDADFISLNSYVDTSYGGSCNHPTQAITILHYFWCSDGQFLFHNYLAISTAVRKFNPEVVYFHAPSLPPTAPHAFEWYEDMKRSVAFLELYETHKATCNSFKLPYSDYLSSILKPGFHHVLVHQNAVVNSRFRRCLSTTNLTVTFVGRNAAIDYLINVPFQWNYVSCIPVKFNTLSHSCHDFVRPSSLCSKDLVSDDICLYFDSEIFLREIPSSSTSLAAYIRNLYYGNSNVISPIKNKVEVIPKIGHYVYLQMTGNEPTEELLEYGFYMSILSLLTIVKVDCVYIHGNVKFYGIFWQRLMQLGYCVRWQHWPFPASVWQQQAKRVEHWADLIRAQVFVQYGGVHSDPDAFFYQPLPDDFWYYEAVIGLDAHVIAPGFKDTPRELRSQVNLGICMSRPGSRFFTLYQKSQQQFYADLWTYNSGIKPLHIYERHPSLAHLDIKLMVICGMGFKCRPNWASTEDEAMRLVNDPSLWFNEARVLHIVLPDVASFLLPGYLGDSEFLFFSVSERILKARRTQHLLM